MKILLKTFVSFCFSLSLISCSNFTVNLTDTATEFISNLDSQAILINYTSKLWENSSLFFSVDSTDSDQIVKLANCSSFEPLQCTELSNPYVLTLNQPNLLFLVEIEPNSTYLIRTFLSDAGTKLITIPSGLLQSEAAREIAIPLAKNQTNPQESAILNFRIHTNSVDPEYDTSLRHEEGQYDKIDCVKDFIGIVQCLVQEDGNYFFSIKNFGINSIFFIDYFISPINVLNPNSTTKIRGMSNFYSFFNITNNDNIPISVSTDLNGFQIYMAARTISIGNSPLLPRLSAKNGISEFGTMIFQPNTSNLLSIFSPNDIDVILSSKPVTINHVPIRREIVINFDPLSSKYAYFETSLDYVHEPFYLVLMNMDNKIEKSSVTWFINRDPNPDKLTIPTEDFHIFSSQGTFYLLVDHPQTIYFTLSSINAGNYSFYLDEKPILTIIDIPSSKPFPYYWILFGILLLELALEFIYLLVLFLRDRFGSSIVVNRESQVQPEAGPANFGPKSADEVKIEGLEDLNIGQIKSKTISKEEILCIICMDKRKSVIFSPCNHKISCVNCSKKLYFETKKCPICRGDIEKLIYEKPHTP